MTGAGKLAEIANKGFKGQNELGVKERHGTMYLHWCLKNKRTKNKYWKQFSRFVNVINIIIDIS